MRKRNVLSFLIVILIGIAAGAVYFFCFYYEKPETAVRHAMDSVKKEDAKTAEQYLDYGLIYDGHEEDMVYQAILRDFNYEITEIEQNGASAVAALCISNRDMEQLYGEFVVDAYQLVISDAYQTEENRKGQEALKTEIDAMLLEKLTEGQTDTRSENIQVEMKRTGRSWYMDIDHEDLDAIYGGYLSAREAADNVLGDLSTETLGNLEKAYQKNIDDANHVLRNAVHYIVDDVWNDRLCQIVSCINAGTDVDGNEYDIEAGIEDLNERLKEKDQYDEYIAALDDINYSSIKTYWNQLTESLDILTQEIEEEQPEPLDFDYIPDTAAFEAAMEQFVKMIYPQE